jgi:hypothetical protein
MADAPATPATPAAPAAPATPAPAAPATPATPAPGAPAATPDKPAAAASSAPGDGASAKKPEGETPAEPAATTNAPEKYTLTLPDRIDPDELGDIEAIARKLDWTNEQAQHAVDDHAAAVEARASRYLERTIADPDYGGDKIAESRKHANAALDRLRPLGTPHGDAFRALLTRSGYNNHLEVVALLADIGKLMAEDTATAFARAGVAPKTTADILYPTTVGVSGP